MSEQLVKTFEMATNWVELEHFQEQEEGYITAERTGDAICHFIWRHDKEPAKLDSMFMGGKTFVRYSDNCH